VITTPVEFEEATAFERLALAEGFPLLATANTTLDLRGGRSAIVDVVCIENGAEARQHLIDRLRPLLFGAAWKVLDLLLELSLHLDGRRPNNGTTWTIAEKRSHASQHRGRSLPWTSHRDLWGRVCRVYCSTAEARHALVHRRFLLSQPGDMTDIRDKIGVRRPDVTVREQEAFAQLAERVAAPTIAATLRKRERSAIAWLLDCLQAHHGQPSLGGAEPVRLRRCALTRPTLHRDGWSTSRGHRLKCGASSPTALSMTLRSTSPELAYRRSSCLLKRLPRDQSFQSTQLHRSLGRGCRRGAGHLPNIMLYPSCFAHR
jgi:hypothetical protein